MTEQCTELERRLQFTEEALRRAEGLAIAGRFAASVMHEVNNPLEAITNLIYLTERNADDPVLVRQRLQFVEEQLKRLRDIAVRTLKFYRQTSKPESFDLVEIVKSALTIYDRRLKSRSIQLKTDFPETLVTICFGSEIFQVLANLVANAIEALAPEGRLTIRMRKRKDEVHIVVADNGHGIPHELRPRIFEPFVTSKTGTGNGLGLWICKTIVEKHKGRIRCRSSVREGRSGTAFRISLAG